jgi:uncharacterized protein Yka (UPF0111/DUF47 family)
MADKKPRKWMANLFPVEHDFFGMLDEQAKLTKEGVDAFAGWLSNGEDRLGLTVVEKEREVDTARLKMEKVLVESFSTPIDRGDLYEVSRQMDQILNYGKSTLREAAALEVLPPQPQFERFGEAMKEGMTAIATAVHLLGSDPAAAEDEIKPVRKATKHIREAYYDCLSDIAKEHDISLALRRREVYHHLKDTGVMMDLTTDLIHRIIVRLL